MRGLANPVEKLIRTFFGDLWYGATVAGKEQD